ncbi:MAG TPA: hypothetical protein VNZ57_03250, partial [Longimicrobiales bacterium]|nr:hypothetical protein [Longimicrobiales bacterium]
TVYAILLGTPEGGSQVMLRAFAEDALPAPVHVLDVRLHETGAALEAELGPEGLVIRLPAEIPGTMALVLEVRTSPR